MLPALLIPVCRVADDPERRLRGAANYQATDLTQRHVPRAHCQASDLRGP